MSDTPKKRRRGKPRESDSLVLAQILMSVESGLDAALTLRPDQPEAIAAKSLVNAARGKAQAALPIEARRP